MKEKRTITGFLKMGYLSDLSGMTVGGVELAEFLRWEDGKKIKITVEVL